MRWTDLFGVERGALFYVVAANIHEIPRLIQICEETTLTGPGSVTTSKGTSQGGRWDCVHCVYKYFLTNYFMDSVLTNFKLRKLLANWIKKLPHSGKSTTDLFFSEFSYSETARPWVKLKHWFHSCGSRIYGRGAKEGAHDLTINLRCSTSTGCV